MKKTGKSDVVLMLGVVDTGTDIEARCCLENFLLLPEQAVMGRGTGLLHRRFRAHKLGFCSELSLKETLPLSSDNGEILIYYFYL